MTWVLIIFVFTGDGVAINSAPGFASEAQCEDAASRVRANFGGLLSKPRTVCAQQGVTR